MTVSEARVSIVIPARNEGEQIRPVLDRILEAVRLPCEVLVVVDTEDDTTIGVVSEYGQKDARVRSLVNTYGRGPANAIRYGIDASAAPVAVVTMADGCDDARQIDDLVRLVERGVAVAAASRYMAGGQQVGGPYLKGLLSKTAGRSLRVPSTAGAPGCVPQLYAITSSASWRGRDPEVPARRCGDAVSAAGSLVQGTDSG